jgi:choline kinase
MDEAQRPWEPTITRAIVLAAGIGSRLGPHTSTLPKPLVPLAGRAIIAYTLDALAEAGVDEAVVVTGHEEHRLRQGLADGPPLPLRFVSNPRYHRRASLSLAAARPFAGDEPFILAMSDHIIDAGVVRLLLALELAEGAAVAADFQPGAHHDIEEATKLATGPANSLPPVTAIGKQIQDWTALDAGAFICTPDTWDALDACPPDSELSAIFGVLAERGLLYAADIDGAFWFDIDTPGDLATAESLMRDAARRLPYK